MVKVSVREFSHDLAAYLKRAEAGEDLLITMHNRPLVNVTRHRSDKTLKGWKRPVKRLVLRADGISASSILEESRREARY